MKPRLNFARSRNWVLSLLSALFLGATGAHAGEAVRADRSGARLTSVNIVSNEFHINGKPTYQGRTWNGHRIEGLLFNSRMVQGIYDDQNPETRQRWAYKVSRRVR